MVYRSSRVDLEVLGKIPGEKAAWGGVRQHPERTTIPGIVVLRVNVSLFWVNATEVQEAILQAVDAAPDTKALILNLEATDQLETTSADMLSELHEQLAERNVDLYLVRVRWRVRTVLAHAGLRARLGEDHLWHNVAQGIREARRQHGIERPGQPEPEPVVGEAEEEIIATPTFDDEPESEAPRRLR
jgi:anti-anti-sigma factor